MSHLKLPSFLRAKPQGLGFKAKGSFPKDSNSPMEVTLIDLRAQCRYFFILGSLRWTPHPVIVAIRDNMGYIKVLLFSYYTTITGWRVL